MLPIRWVIELVQVLQLRVNSIATNRIPKLMLSSDKFVSPK